MVLHMGGRLLFNPCALKLFAFRLVYVVFIGMLPTFYTLYGIGKTQSRQSLIRYFGYRAPTLLSFLIPGFAGGPQLA